MIAFILVKKVWDVTSYGLVVLEGQVYDGDKLRSHELYPLLGHIYQDEAEIKEEVRDVLGGVCEVVISEI